MKNLCNMVRRLSELEKRYKIKSLKWALGN